jgi:small nuclear ribonucleoprotein (snRNP)-like protein
MSILSEQTKKSIGKNVIIFLNNGWKYSGKITNADDVYVEILRDQEYTSARYKIIKYDDIKDIDIMLD